MITKTIKRCDLEGLTRSYMSAFRVEPWGERWEYKVAIERIESYYNCPNFCGLLIKDNDKIVGGALGLIKIQQEGYVYELAEFFISETYQSKGYGTRLYSNLLEYLKKQGIIGILIITTRGTAAHNFYHKMGAKLMEDTINLSQNVE